MVTTRVTAAAAKNHQADAGQVLPVIGHEVIAVPEDGHKTQSG